MLESLAARPGEKELPLIERLRLWIADRAPGHDEELEDLRRRAITSDPDLCLIEHRYLDRFAGVVAAAVAEEIGAAPRDPGPQAFAAAFLGVFLALRDRRLGDTRKGKPEDALAVGFKFLGACLAAIHEKVAATASH